MKKKSNTKLIVNFQRRDMEILNEAVKIDMRSKSHFVRMILLREAKRIIEEASKNAKR